LGIKGAFSASTFVICGECGSSIYPGDPESLVAQQDQMLLLRCRNGCCGHVDRYSVTELRTFTASRTIDHTSKLLVEG
jgi:RNase P subunit RPR2